MQPSRLRARLPLFLAVFIDIFSFGLMYPLIVGMFHTGWVAQAYSPASRDAFLSLAFSLFPVGMFFGASLLGDLSDALGNRRLNFSFRVEPVPGNTSESGPVTLSVESTNSAGSTQPLVQRVSGARGSVDVPVDDVKVDLPADAERVRLTVGGLKGKEMVRIVELQLVADDVSPGLGEALCENK